MKLFSAFFFSQVSLQPSRTKQTTSCINKPFIHIRPLAESSRSDCARLMLLELTKTFYTWCRLHDDCLFWFMLFQMSVGTCQLMMMVVSSLLIQHDKRTLWHEQLKTCERAAIKMHTKKRKKVVHQIVIIINNQSTDGQLLSRVIIGNYTDWWVVTEGFLWYNTRQTITQRQAFWIWWWAIMKQCVSDCVRSVYRLLSALVLVGRLQLSICLLTLPAVVCPILTPWNTVLLYPCPCFAVSMCSNSAPMCADARWCGAMRVDACGCRRCGN